MTAATQQFSGTFTADPHHSTSGDSPTVVLTSSRDAADFGDLVAQSGARGFIPKTELSGARLTAVLE